MSDATGFTVFYPGLIEAAKHFTQASSTYESILPDGGPGVPRGGNNAIDRAMELTLTALGNCHNVIANVVDSHSYKLVEVHSNYSTAESNIIDSILSSAYSRNDPIPATPQGQASGTVPQVPKIGGKFSPSPVRVPVTISTPSSAWQGLRYWHDYTGSTASAPNGVDPWIGGDLKGLSELAAKLKVFAYQSKPIEQDLIAAVKRLLGQSGQWTGTGAYNFANAFSWDAANMQILGEQVATPFAQKIEWLVWALSQLEIGLENCAQALVDHGCRVVFDGDGFQVSATSSWDHRVQLNLLNDLYKKSHQKATNYRNAVAHQISQLYQILLGVLDYYIQDNDGRLHKADL